MRRIVLVALAAATALVTAACERAERPSMFEPVFGRVEEPPNPCPAILGLSDPADGVTSKYEIVQQLYLGIDNLFMDARSRNGAKSHVDNVVREVCAGDYAGAAEFVRVFIQQVENQPDDMLSDELPHVAELVNWVRVLATELHFTLPEGVLGFTGALVLTDGGPAADPVKTRNGHVIVNASDFPAGEPFVVAIAPGKGEYGDYVVYGNEDYQIATDGLPDLASEPDGVLIVFCGTYPADLRIAHDKGTGGVELLEPEYVPAGVCSGSTSALLKGAPTWLRSLGRLAGGAITALGPTPVHARRETGLGGRTKSFSPFAVVEPIVPLTLTCESRLAGTISVLHDGEELCSAGKDMVTTVTTQLPAGALTLTAQAVGYTRRHDIWFSSGTLTLDPALCPPKWPRSPASCTFTLPPTGGSLKVKLTGY